MGHEGTLVSRDLQDVDYLHFSSTSFSPPQEELEDIKEFILAEMS